MKFEHLERILSEGDLLVHTSLADGIRQLNPGVEASVFATENISFAITCALIKLNLENSPILIHTYRVAGIRMTICSVDREYQELLRHTRLHFYFCRKDLFTKDRKIESKLSRKTKNLIENLGHEWKCPHTITPSFARSACLKDLLPHTTHARSDSKVKIALRYGLHNLPPFRKRPLIS
jgi:hypothetical protein